jgi:hypothetical protein
MGHYQASYFQQVPHSPQTRGGIPHPSHFGTRLPRNPVPRNPRTVAKLRAVATGSVGTPPPTRQKGPLLPSRCNIDFHLQEKSNLSDTQRKRTCV